MNLNQEQTYYDILELGPDAPPEKIREAYLRLKAAYSKDSLALYSVIDPSETDEFRQKIEEAYSVLSDTIKRQVYDRDHRLFQNESGLLIHTSVQPSTLSTGTVESPPLSQEKVVSIDRVPPMENVNEDSLLVAPRRESSFNELPPVRSTPPIAEVSRITPAAYNGFNPYAVKREPKFDATVGLPMSQEEQTLLTEIEKERDWTGSFLKKVREARGIALEEMVEYTKINKSYIRAIEDEEFTKLPAAVFVRGFVTQVAKRLKLPHEKVAEAYCSRFLAARPQKG